MAEILQSGIEYALTTSLATTPAIDMTSADGGHVVVPTGSTITTLTYHGLGYGTTYVAMYDNDDVAVTQTVGAAVRMYPIPAELNACKEIKIVADAAGSVYVTTKRMSRF